MEFIIDGKFKLVSCLGRGSFGALYAAKNLKSNEEVAVKLEKLNSPSPQLQYEAQIYRNLNSGSNHNKQQSKF
jgi:serine/threonine protein kinase